MTREELDKKIEEARKRSEVLSQAEIDELLKAIAAGAEDLSSIRKSRKIKICDFKRPDKFSKQELRDISNVSEIYAKEIKSFLACEYDINAKVQIASVDQLTFEEQVRSLPTPIPFCTFKWGEGAGMLSLDPALFYEGFFNHPIKKNRIPNGFEQKVFFNYIYKPFEKILYETYSTKAGAPLPEIIAAKCESNPVFATGVCQPGEMGVLIMFEVKIGKTEAFMNLYLNAEFLEALRKTNFFSTYGVANYVPLSRPKPNTIVEVGCFHLEEWEVLKEKYVYELNNLAGNPLQVYKDGKYVGAGEAVVIDDNNGVRITTNPDKLEERNETDFYNTKVIFGGRITPEDYKFEEGCILELWEYNCNPIKIEKAGKTIGLGEIVVVGENFGIKVTQVL